MIQAKQLSYRAHEQAAEYILCNENNVGIAYFPAYRNEELQRLNAEQIVKRFNEYESIREALQDFVLITDNDCTGALKTILDNANEVLNRCG